MQQVNSKPDHHKGSNSMPRTRTDFPINLYCKVKDQASISILLTMNPKMEDQRMNQDKTV